MEAILQQRRVRKLRPKPPPVMPGFEHINRYWDRRHGTFAAKILPGEYYVNDGSEMIATVLGSCISACIRDRVFGVGGMNHFMLPKATEKSSDAWAGTAASASTRYGNQAMEQLINTILKRGGRRENLEVKVFGGADVMRVGGGVGLGNVAFVRHYLEMEGLEIAGEDLGDICPRRVLYFPASGRVLMRKLRSLHNDTLMERERHYEHTIEEQPPEGEIDLF